MDSAFKSSATFVGPSTYIFHSGKEINGLLKVHLVHQSHKQYRKSTQPN